MSGLSAGGPKVEAYRKGMDASTKVNEIIKELYQSLLKHLFDTDVWPFIKINYDWMMATLRINLSKSESNYDQSLHISMSEYGGKFTLSFTDNPSFPSKDALPVENFVRTNPDFFKEMLDLATTLFKNIVYETAENKPITLPPIAQSLLSHRPIQYEKKGTVFPSRSAAAFTAASTMTSTAASLVKNPHLNALVEKVHKLSTEGGTQYVIKEPHQYIHKVQVFLQAHGKKFSYVDLPFLYISLETYDVLPGVGKVPDEDLSRLQTLLTTFKTEVGGGKTLRKRRNFRRTHRRRKCRR